MRTDRLTALRKEKGYSMRQMAIALNLPYKTYVNYEKGERGVNSEMLLLMAKYFDTSVDYLLGNADDRAITNAEMAKIGAPKDVAEQITAPEPHYTDDEMFVLEKYKRLSIPNRYQALKLMDEMWEEQEQEKSAGKIG